MSNRVPDFDNTAIAFAIKTDHELKKMRWLFDKMNRPWLVNLGAKLGLTAIKYNFPFAKTILKNTLFEQFCGGRTLLECLPLIDKLGATDVLTILDYGAEAKQSEEDFNLTMNQTIRSLEFASQSKFIPVVSTKITGMGRFELLEKMDAGLELTQSETEEYQHILKRIDAICYNANQFNVAIFIDAEESWIQKTVDEIARKMMMRYNQGKIVVYNTYQMYRHESLANLKHDHQIALQNNFVLGAKIVRGAYMEKERQRASELGYASPIQPDKETTDKDYNQALEYSIEHIESIASCCATHNRYSSELYAKLLAEKNISGNHPHVMTSQLYGMSDLLTFNLADAGIRSAKYLPYGPEEDVMPYLLRRAQENTSVTGDMSREYKYIVTEIKRRKAGTYSLNV